MDSISLWRHQQQHVQARKVMFPARGYSNDVLFACVQAREDLIDRVCKKEMGVYAQIFSSTGETAQLDRMERRCWLAQNLLAVAQNVRWLAHSAMKAMYSIHVCHGAFLLVASRTCW